MRNIYRKLVVAFTLMSCAVANAQGFTTNNTNGDLIDANGQPFIMKGMNMALAWYESQVNGSIADVRKNTKSNCIRICVETRLSDASWQTAVDNCIKNNMIPMVELHDVTGSTNENDLVRMGQFWASKAAYFKRPEIAKYILINIANEWGTWQVASSNGASWKNASTNAIKAMRDAGIKTTIVVDAVGYGQDVNSAQNIRSYAKDIQASDAGFLKGQANLLFSVHMYCEWKAGANYNILGTIKKSGIPIIVGEFGYQHTEGSGTCDIDEKQILNSCQANSVGWLAWSQKGNGSGVEYLDLCNDWACTSLSGWGNTIINGANGTKTAITCSVFTGPVKTYGTNLALNKPVTVSTTEPSLGNIASNATDGDKNTRWSSEYADPQWIQIDLGKTYRIDTIVLRWEAAYASAYKVETSLDGITWAQANTTANGDGGVDELANLAKEGRYVRLTGTQRATTFGYSLYEVEVYGKSVVTTLDDEAYATTTVYPNPFHDKINLNLSSEAELQLTDIKGAVLYNGFGHEIETSALPLGMYVLKIRQNGSTRVIKMSKN